MNPPASKPPFTTPSRMLCILVLMVIAGVMYWIATTDAMDGTKKLIAASGVLMAGLLVIAGGAHFTDGRHRK